MHERLEKLRAEFARGQERLSQLEAEAAQLRQTMLRISGAIQVLEEELGAKAPDAAGDG
jgi:predicted nuclease with TOPRIM domain